MARFPVPEFDDLPRTSGSNRGGNRRRRIHAERIFSAMAYKPSHFRAFFDYHDALVEDTALEREEIEMIVVAVSGVNHCYYCNVAHGALVRIYADDPLLADQLVANYRTADINDAHRKMLDVAVKLTERPTEVRAGRPRASREAGFSEALWDIASVTAFYNPEQPVGDVRGDAAQQNSTRWVAVAVAYHPRSTTTPVRGRKIIV